MISAIVAVDDNWGIGYQGDLLAHIPSDMAHFRLLTKNRVVVMGRKTWDSLPHKPLPDRLNIIISSQPREVLGDLSIRLNMEEIKVRLEAEKTEKDDEWFIIGGEKIYKELLPFCDRVYLTRIYKSYENVDTYFPELTSDEWKLVHEGDRFPYKDFEYQFQTFDRIN